VYLACLQLGTGPVVKIAQKAGMPRSTVYEILDALRSLGLVSTFQKKKVRYFSAEEPEHLIRYAETKVNLLKDVLPELNALSGKSRQRPAVRFYQGRAQMQIVLDGVLNEATELLAFGVSEDLLNLMGNYHKNFVAMRVKKKIPLRIILRDSPTALQRKQLGIRELRNVKIIPATQNYHGLTYVWKNKIAMFAFVGDLVAVVIESKELADMQRAMMEYLWERI
jgi:sugar-specific transcriptional regulator TrmB